jgi:hypothetical protein
MDTLKESSHTNTQDDFFRVGRDNKNQQSRKERERIIVWMFIHVKKKERKEKVSEIICFVFVLYREDNSSKLQVRLRENK